MTEVQSARVHEIAMRVSARVLRRTRIDPADAAQETMLALLAAESRGYKFDDLEGIALVAARRTAIGLIRRSMTEKVIRHCSLDQMVDQKGHWAAALDDPIAAVVALEAAEQIGRILPRLRQVHQDEIRNHYWLGRVLTGASKQMLARARHAFAVQLAMQGAS